MTNFAYLGLAAGCLLSSCSGSVNNENPQTGGGIALGGGASTGGATLAGGSLGLGGTLAASGGASTRPSTTGGFSGANCALVGCAMPPLCSTGCTEPCGCCPCSDGTKNGDLVCKGGCWADSAAGGASSTGGRPATGGNSSSGGLPNSGGSASTAAGGVCGTGCTFETTDSPFCTAGLASLACGGGVDYSTVSAIMQANDCTMGASDAIRYCCPPAMLTQCR